jgi:ABC-type multidrug transport system ATPase subunit
MMRVSLTDAGKRFNRDWIFRHISQEFRSGAGYALTGPNGSGKSTLLQVIAGALLPSEGKVSYADDKGALSDDEQFHAITICAPYLELIEEMTAMEFLSFHAMFKPWIAGPTPEEMLERVGLFGARDKQVRWYSSGMKQRLKLLQAFYSDTSVLLLDEPCTNLDQSGIEIYRSLVGELTRDRLIIVSSNDKVEYDFCGNLIWMPDYKKGPSGN